MLRSGRSNSATTTWREMSSFRPGITRSGDTLPYFVIPGLKDDISRHIVVALFDRPDRNISQITEAVKGKRGTASRRIVRARLADLKEQGIVVATPGSRTRTFRVADGVAEKWSQVLGVPKYRDQPHEDQEIG